MDFKDTVLGLELGSTRIKAVLLDKDHKVIASGAYEWENTLLGNIWTYSMTDAVKGLQECYAGLKKDVQSKFGATLTEVGAIGISGMMHGYLPFDKDGNQLAEFRTWRNTITGVAAEKLSALFNFNVPQRWSVAHLYQAVLNGEAHLPKLASITTLAGYIHRLLTGENVMGVGEASGMFPIDPATLTYDAGMMEKFCALLAPYGYGWNAADLFPKVLPAGVCAGALTAEGAKLLDPAGDLRVGIPFAPPEGDMQTGIVATNSARAGTGNVSAGTSINASIVTDQTVGVHPEIDVILSPSGNTAALVHCNNCTTDINAWVNLFGEFAAAIGAPQDKGKLFTVLFEKALEGDPSCGGLISFNYHSGEVITGLDEGRTLFVRKQSHDFTLANFMRTHLLSALATLKLGMDILTEQEKIRIDKLYGHGGYFKTPGVGQRLLSAAIGVPVTVMETAGEGGPYGMALLAAYMIWRDKDEKLEDYLDNKVFASAATSTAMADEADLSGFAAFIEDYKKALAVEKAAVEAI